MAAGDVLRLQLQAPVGLFRSDRFRLAASADGSIVFEGLSVDLIHTDTNDQGAFDAENNFFVAPASRHLPLRRVAALHGQRERPGLHEQVATF